jgi:transcriptional regulator with XRE-family HTH domain
VPYKNLEGMDWLHERMQSLGLSSLEQVAERCGLNRGNLYRYFSFETRPSIDVLPPLCEGLKSSPEEVLRALGIQVAKNRSK